MFCVKILSYCVIVVFVQGADPPHICTYDGGCYDGLLKDGFEGGPYEAFLGIPYAERARRFYPPKRFYTNTTKTIQATHARFACIQKNYVLPGWPITGEEDCLYLNVYRPVKRTKHFLAVIVYIHGGGFFSGTTAPYFIGPDYIMDNGDVVLVTIAYRLGAFGFLATGDGVIPGNLGLKDQVEALRWVFRNIDQFSGDRFLITLIGQNAGAVSVHMHMFSKLSVFLFHAAVLISGTANTYFAIDNNPEDTARRTARECNITDWDTISTTELAAALDKVSTYTLLDAADGLKYWDADSLSIYRPIVEPDYPYSFLKKHPDVYISSGDFYKVPVMFGRVPNEGSVRAVGIVETDALRNDFNFNFYELMTKLMEFPPNFNETVKAQKTELIVDEYFNDNAKLLDEYTVQIFMDLLTDRIYYHPFFTTVKHYVDTVDTRKYPVFLYNFNHVGLVSYAGDYVDHNLTYNYGVTHGDDLIYLIRNKFLLQFLKKSPDSKLVKMYVDDLIYFAYRGRYYSPGVVFQACNKTTFFIIDDDKTCDYHEFYMSTDGRPRKIIKNDFDKKRMYFWDDILNLEH